MNSSFESTGVPGTAVVTESRVENQTGCVSIASAVGAIGSAIAAADAMVLH